MSFHRFKHDAVILSEAYFSGVEGPASSLPGSSNDAVSQEKLN
jgi:hypothetical protein